MSTGRQNYKNHKIKEDDIKNAMLIKTFLTKNGKGFHKVDQKLKDRMSSLKVV